MLLANSFPGHGKARSQGQGKCERGMKMASAAIRQQHPLN